MNIDTIKQDIWSWITDFVEVPHQFYNYKFPPCPYARAARLKNLVDVQVYSGRPTEFFLEACCDIVEHKHINVRVLVFPYYMRWNYWLRRCITQHNYQMVKDDYYAQYGAAVNTQSQFPGLFKHKPYFIVIINKLSDVLDAQASLEKTDYYQHWTDKHYTSVVVDRRRVYEKGTSNNEMD